MAIGAGRIERGHMFEMSERSTFGRSVEERTRVIQGDTQFEDPS